MFREGVVVLHLGTPINMSMDIIWMTEVRKQTVLGAVVHSLAVITEKCKRTKLPEFKM